MLTLGENEINDSVFFLKKLLCTCKVSFDMLQAQHGPVLLLGPDPETCSTSTSGEKYNEVTHYMGII